MDLSENKRQIMRIQSLGLLYCEPVEEKGHMDFKGEMENKQPHQNPLGSFCGKTKNEETNKQVVTVL